VSDSDAKQIEALIASIPNDEIGLLLGRQRFYALHRLVTGEASDNISGALIARYAVAVDGSRLLEDRGILAALLLRLPAPQLRALTKRYLDQPFTRDADNALALASKPLRAGATLTTEILSALGLSDFVLREVERKTAIEIIEPYEPLPPLLDYQEEVRGMCAILLAGGKRELLLQMPTGAGKTRTAMEIVVDLALEQSIFSRGDSVVWLAHTEELCEQAIDAFSSAWATRGTDRAHVVRMFGSYTPQQSHFSGGLVVGGTARIHAFSKDPQAFGVLSGKSVVVVVDEAHRALAPTVQAQIAALRRSTNGILIGLSATPARSNEASRENTELAALFGHNLVTPSLGDDPINELRRKGILAKLNRVELRYTSAEIMPDGVDIPSNQDGDDFPESVLASLAENPDRNLAIIDELERRVAAGEPAIVFCCSVAHSVLLGAALRLRGIRAASIDCRMRRGARRLAIQHFARGEIDVLLNFGVLSTGFDAPNVQTVMIARPTKSVILYSQMIGRGLRGPKMGGTETCTLIDVRDHLGRFGDLSELYLRFKPYWERPPGNH